MNESIVRVSQVFFGWKLVLLSLLYAVPRQYDTSTHLFLTGCDANASWFWRVLAHGIEKLVIWDSVFYANGAERGLIYEHEWAFGRGWSLLIGILTPKSLTEWDESPLKSTYYYGLTGIILAIASHYLATIVLYYLTKLVFSRRRDVERYACVVATLYALSPAGMFLIAGYAEAPFALASFIGLYLRHNQYYVFSGMFFAFSCALRGNGVLWGLLFLYDLANLSIALLENITGMTIPFVSKNKESEELFFSRKEPKGEALRGSNEQNGVEASENGNQGSSFSRTEPKGEALRGSNEQSEPEIREADPGGLGASPQKTVPTNEQSGFIPQKAAKRTRVFNLRELGQGGSESRDTCLQQKEPRAIVFQMVRVIAGGTLIGLMVIGLQLYPYLLFCPGRPWCEKTIPSIFGYVQSEYWNVGFMRYWTPNNIPNFLFGGPTLYLLYRSLVYYRHERVLRPVLLVQLVVLVTALLVYHVQIITRIATCLPAMYWYVGSLLTSTNLTQVKMGKRVVNYFILWTMAHAILFGAFLPPA